jgi:uncharacterized protein YgiM (DUF1202 family)
MKKTVKLFLTAFLVAVFPNIFIEDATKARALSPKHTTSKAYTDSIYYNNLINLDLTDDQATNTVLVALSQVGYHEGNSTSELNGYNLNGSKNFVEYTKITGKLDGYANDGYAYAWCASFVSWSLTHANIPKTLYGGNAPGCHTLVSNLKKAGAKLSYPKNYNPKTGDLIFFKSADGTNPYSHVGLVIYSDDAKVYTVEGNASQNGYNGAGGVVTKEYSLSYNRISIYATPKYMVGEKVVDFSSSLLGRYHITASSLNIRKAPSATAKAVGTLKKGELVTVTKWSDGWGKISFNGDYGYISQSYAVYLHSENTLTENPPTTDTIPPAQLPPSSDNESVIPPTNNDNSTAPPNQDYTPPMDDFDDTVTIETQTSPKNNRYLTTLILLAISTPLILIILYKPTTKS